MRLVIFGLTISSSWGNGHATLWRGLCGALGRMGHRTTFFERDVPYYAAHRDLQTFDGGRLRLYAEWDDVAGEARKAVDQADAAIVTSYCPDAIAATELVLGSRGLRVFYDLDTPITLARLDAAAREGAAGHGGGAVAYLGPRGLRDFDLVLSYTGGAALEALRSRLGARRVAPLYGSVDPAAHRPAPRPEGRRAALSYLGTYAADRQAALDKLFLEVARRRPEERFLLGGSLYPDDFPWTANLDYVRHVPPGRHASFYASAALTLNVTRGPMAAMGYCPSGRLFEAAACGVPILSDAWEGIERFFTPGTEILLAGTTEEALAAISMPEQELEDVACAARERALTDHTAARRAVELARLLESGGA
ncbi:MAG: glycosyltransferase [Polyangiaceae bacterium]|nr:glycosyltransferase [Polyangiaceae bacterium]